jgi:hypothetical protein
MAVAAVPVAGWLFFGYVDPPDAVDDSCYSSWLWLTGERSGEDFWVCQPELFLRLLAAALLMSFAVTVPIRSIVRQR